MHVAPKEWGEEHWIVNKEYCGKKLILKKNRRCSMHQHKEKDEVFYLQSGKVLMEIGGKEYTLKPGDSIHVPCNTPHRFTGLELSEIIEFSTTHKEEDSYRSELSGHVEPQRYSLQSNAIAAFKDARVLVVGDVMIDIYLHGNVDRISPEAPVPVVRYKYEEAVPGGAANVAMNISMLGGTATLIGVCGDDEGKNTLADALDAHGITSMLVHDTTRLTTQKTRIVSHGKQQLLRFDAEQTHPLTATLEKQLLDLIKKQLPNHDVLLLSDYAKGVFSPGFLKGCIALAQKKKMPVLLDPKPLDSSYIKAIRGVSLILPNKREAQIMNDSGTADIEQLATDLSKKAKTIVLLTAGEQGMVLANGKKITTFPAITHSVIDVSGAGDTVAATIALASAVNLDLGYAADLANRAASVVVTKAGTATLTQEELLNVL